MIAILSIIIHNCLQVVITPWKFDSQNNDNYDLAERITLSMNSI